MKKKKSLLLAATFIIAINMYIPVFVEASKETADLYYNEGLNYIEKHQYKEAITVLEKALREDPNRAEIYHKLGSCYHALRDFSKAVSYYEKGINANPNYADNYISIGSAYYNLGQPKEAKEYLIKARTILQAQGDYQRITSVQHLIDVLEQKGY